MVSMKLEDAQVHRMRLIPGLQLQVILLILSGAPGLASANGTRCLPDFENIGGRNYRGTGCSESCRLLESEIRNPQWKDRGGAAIIRVHAKS